MKIEITNSKKDGPQIVLDKPAERLSKAALAEFIQDAIHILQLRLLDLEPNNDHL